MTSGMIILSDNSKLPFCFVFVQSKITRQPHCNPHTPSEIPGFSIHLDVRESANVYITWKDYHNFAFLVNDATKVTCVCFIKKKSETISIFRNFVVIMDRYYNIKICILYTDFGKFNFDAATEYFNYIGIT